MNQKNTSIPFIFFLFAAINIHTYGQAFFTEDFEGSPNAATDLPVGWTESGLSTDGIWSTGDNTQASSPYLTFPAPTNGTLFAYTNDDECNCNKSNDRMFIPVQDFSMRSCVTLSFDLYLNGGYGEQGNVLVSVNGGTIWDTVYTATGNATAWQDDISVSLFNYAGEASVLIAFAYNDNASWSYAMAIDDVTLTETVTSFTGIAAAGEYTKIPLSLVTSLPLDASFTGVFCEGSIDDARVISTVWSSANGFSMPIQSDTSSDNTLMSDDTLYTSIGTFTPSDTGRYILRHVISSPSNPIVADANDTIEYAFSVTLDQYARDDSIVTVSLGANGTVNTVVLGTNYHLPNPATISSVLAGFSSLQIGDTTFLFIYQTDLDGMPTTKIDSFEHILQINSPNVEEIIIPGGISLPAGTFFFGVSETKSVDNMGLQYTSQIYTPGAGWGSLNNGPFMTIEAFGFPNTALIRPILCGPARIMAQQTEYCQNDLSDTLKGLPYGGSFSGAGITDSIFDPFVAGPGMHVIKYTYTGSMGCVSVDSVTILVRGECDGACVQLNLVLTSHPDNAAQTYRAISDITSSAVMMNPPHNELTYKAGNAINLQSDFQIGPGVIFNAFIDSCPPLDATVIKSPEQEVAVHPILSKTKLLPATNKVSSSQSPNIFNQLSKAERAQIPRISAIWTAKGTPKP